MGAVGVGDAEGLAVGVAVAEGVGNTVGRGVAVAGGRGVGVLGGTVGTGVHHCASAPPAISTATSHAHRFTVSRSPARR